MNEGDRNSSAPDVSADAAGEVAIQTRHKLIRPRGANQTTYMTSIRDHDLAFGIGPAGTGKTYLAVACAIDALENEQVRRIVLVRPAVEAGALGFSTSRTLNHRTSDGQPTPTLTASEKELTGIAMALGEAGKGVLQFVSDFNDPQKEAAMLRRIVERSGRPLSVSLAQADVAPDGWKLLLQEIESASADGLDMRAQVGPRPVGLLLGLELTLNPFSGHPVYQTIANEPFEKRVHMLSDPAFQHRLLNDQPDADNPFVKSILRSFGKMFVLGDPPDYEPTDDKTVAAIAKARGTTPEAVALDLMEASAITYRR